MIGLAAIQALAFGASVLMHLGMGYALGRILPENYHYLRRFLEGAIALVFSLIYLAIAVETLVIFVPALGGVKDLIEGRGRKYVEDEIRKSAVGGNAQAN